MSRMSKAEQVGAAAVAVGAFAVLASLIEFDEPPALDRRVRAIARSEPWRNFHGPLRPLFPIGLPGGYITIAYATAHWLHRRRRRGGPAIVTAAWAGWLVHRGIKLFYIRQRPLDRGKRYRIDSFPSGHTTGATALALTTARVLRRDRLISRQAAVLIATGAPLVMGTYRVLADDHWATDVVGGWLLGGAIGLVCDAELGASRSGVLTAPAARRRGRSRRGRPARARYAG